MRPGSSPRAGYTLALIAAASAGLNGSLARYLLDDGLSAWRLTQLRTTLAFAVLVPVLVVTARGHAVPRLCDLRRIAPVAVAMTTAQAAYFLSTTRMPIAMALLVQYLYPLLLLLWLRIGHGRRLHVRLWAAVCLSVAGTLLAVGGAGVTNVDGLGIAAGIVSAVAFAVYIVGSERFGDHYHPVTATAWTFGIAAVLWALVQPVWSFPVERLQGAALATALGVVAIGTLVPFTAIVAAVSFVPAARVSVVLTAETVFGGAFAFLLHGEGLSATQLAGAAVVVASLVWLQVQPVDAAAERAPRPAAPT